ncbi:MAG: DUF4286 family protein [Chitinophagaceae bacterium]|nr:MAG: DUF4286 family protein [Chitinophagaceae bacterium]
MIVYNITTKVAVQVSEEWLQWLQAEHVPEILNTGCFTAAKLMRLLEQNDSEGPTYTVQFTTSSIAAYEYYLAEHADELRQKAFDKWGNQFISFRSLMEIVQ